MKNNFINTKGASLYITGISRKTGKNQALLIWIDLNLGKVIKTEIKIIESLPKKIVYNNDSNYLFYFLRVTR